MTTIKWLELMALFFTIVGGIVLFWEKIPIGVKLIVTHVKRWISLKKAPPSNPFGDQGCITESSRFFGREYLLHEIFEELGKGSNLSLIGESKIGKSSLLYQICQLGYKKTSFAEKNFINLDLQCIHDEGDFFKELCREIDIPESRGSDLKRALQGKRYILCLDEIERLTSKLFTGDERTELSGLSGYANAPLTLLIASRSPLAELFPDSPLMTSPLANVCKQMDIGSFSQKEVRAFIETRLQPTSVQFTEAEIETIWQETQGHPARVQEMAEKLYRQR
jgi:hypothetical protein